VQARTEELEHGRLALVALDDDAAYAAALAALPEGERALAANAGPGRRKSLVAGRLAMRVLLPDAPPILVDDRGAPLLPAAWVGSIAHKGDRGTGDSAVAVALVAPATGAHIGVDLERAGAPRVDIAHKILTPRELVTLPDRGPAVTLRFAIKEAIYKAVDPFVRRYVGFHEVELELGDGDCDIIAPDLPVAIEARWRELDGYWLATARATRSPSP
jgi:4'-phosphopantetheinyl transferase EntD